MQLIDLSHGQASATGLSRINVLLGRNGAGKSRFLRVLDEGLGRNHDYNVNYISPERAGVFRRDGNILNNMERNPRWIHDTRRRNQAENFKAASANRLRDIETAYLRKLQDTPNIRTDPDRNFHVDCLDKINRLLTNITIIQHGSEFSFEGTAGDVVEADQISSGESEAVSLAAEIMYFFSNLDKSKTNVLLLDEPDVHLHPDLQARLARFVYTLVSELDEETRTRLAIVIATHSTPLACAFAGFDVTSIGTKEFGNDFVRFERVSGKLMKVAPFFGHPLSLSLSNDVLLIVEGEDDERVWQQASRSSNGRIKLFPVVATSVDHQTELETFCSGLLRSLYDRPIAYSLRDGDGVSEALPSIGPVKRFRLSCYSIENALLSDECLSALGLTWSTFTGKTREWLASNPGHKDFSLMKMLIESSDRLRNTKIKAVRQLICSMGDSKKPWEVLLGQTIATLNVVGAAMPEHSMSQYIGESVLNALLRTGDSVNTDASTQPN